MLDLIERLKAWKPEDREFHSTRQLADEILVADGWSCESDPAWEGGIRWLWGTNPQISSSESHRPHPINDLNAAAGCVPIKHNWRLSVSDGFICVAHVWPTNEEIGDDCLGVSAEPAMALVIAALKASAKLKKVTG
jgi:hypothetical protein